MQINRSERISIITTLDKLYDLIANNTVVSEKCTNGLTIAAKLLTKLKPIFHNNPLFVPLYNNVHGFLTNQIKCSDIELLEHNKIKFLNLLRDFELSLLDQFYFDIYLHNCTDNEYPINMEYVQSVTDSSLNTITQDSIVSLNGDQQSFSVLIYQGQNDKTNHTDFCFTTDEIKSSLNELILRLKNLDYYKYDKVYLETKLNSLKRRQDIQLLLAGSSYTMCGLFEKHMHLPARNVAVDAQDLYYTLKTIRTAIKYNQNIKCCIVSFAYYFWGYDLSLSTSTYQTKRITEVNYPVFMDKHNFSGDPTQEMESFLINISPLKMRLFSFDVIVEKYINKLKKQIEDSHYFPYQRIDSEALKHSDETNKELALRRASSHNKFFKYIDTVRENQKLFADFVCEMNSKNVELIFYVPPVTEYYRNSIDPELINDFNKYMKPMQEKFNFQLIDLFNSNTFGNEDFADYDHLNDIGAKKLAEILVEALKI